MPGVVEVGSDRLLASFAAVAKYYGVAVDVCAPRRANRKGAVEKRNDFLTGRWWRTMTATTQAAAQALLDRFVETICDKRRRQQQPIAELADTEPLLALPAQPYPASLSVERVVSAACLVAFRGNQYAVLPGLEGGTVQVHWQLGSATMDLIAASGTVLATHTLAPAGAGRIVRSDAPRAALETAIFASLTTASPCPRKVNPPPGPAAQAAAAVLRGTAAPDIRVDLYRYAEFAAVAR